MKSIIVGVDEVGRGPLIGNVVTAAVILPPECDLPLTDSKKLSEANRKLFYKLIQDQAIDYAIGYATPTEIDQLNILQATMLAMQRAVHKLKQPFDEVWVDGNRCPELKHKCKSIVKGDLYILAISAASILAKVTRDNEMQVLDKKYPEYGFAQHKGYPTKQHLINLQKYGLINGYRKSFKPIKSMLKLHQQ